MFLYKGNYEILIDIYNNIIRAFYCVRSVTKVIIHLLYFAYILILLNIYSNPTDYYNFTVCKYNSYLLQSIIRNYYHFHVTPFRIMNVYNIMLCI